MSRPVAVVTGMIASYPVGGVVWDYGQYALGLERLGWDVYYLEDTGWKFYDPVAGSYEHGPAYGVGFVQDALTGLSPTLGERWHVRAMDDTTYGVDAASFRDVLDEADLFLNVSGGTLLRPEYLPCRNKVLIDTDPGWNHFRNWPKWKPKEDWPESAPFSDHDHFFTYAELLGTPGCILPDFGLDWHPTRPPVVLDAWRQEPPGTTWTTIMTWKNFAEKMTHDGVVYGTKEMEFPHVEALPTLVGADLELAVGGAGCPEDRWRSLGWSVIESDAVSRSVDDYRSYVQRSRGEFSVAKNVYVGTRSGWFSCRSVCYLAAGRPVVVQDTGFSEVIPTGKGLLSFTCLDEAASAIEMVEGDYEAHARVAREVATEVFDSARVLSEMLTRIL